MDLGQEFTWATARQLADHLVFQATGKHLSDVECQVLQGAWEGKNYSLIAEELGYTLEYINSDVGYGLWTKLSQATDEKVTKRNFRGALERSWLSKQTNLPDPLAQTKNLMPLAGLQFYIDRPPIEQRCFEAIGQPGALIRIKAPQKMGKTWLVRRILNHVQAQDYRIVPINLLGIESAVISDLERFLKSICGSVTRQLQMENRLADYWDEELGSNTSCTEYFETYILRHCDDHQPDAALCPIVLALDNVDRLFSYPEVAANFFGLLRAWYEDARILPDWQRLRLIISHSTDIYPTLNINQSPFNVGLSVELTEFTPEQVKQLAQGQGVLHKFSQPQFEKLAQMMAGHPYLCQQAFEQLRLEKAVDLETFLAIAPTEAGPYAQHFRRLLAHLHDNPELAIAMRTILQADAPVQIRPELGFMLHSLGLVRLLGNTVEVHCPLYQRYFSERLE